MYCLFISIKSAVILAVTGAILLLIAGFILLKRIVIHSNKIKNSLADSALVTGTAGKLINDQIGNTGRHFVYGFYRARWNACEAIAVHNLRVLLGDTHSSLSQTIYDFQKSSAMIGFGFFGSNPYRICKVLNKYRIDYCKVGFCGLTQAGVYIISYWTGTPWMSPIHTVAVNYDGRTYYTYNIGGNGCVSLLAPSEYAKKYICGYLINTGMRKDS